MKHIQKFLAAIKKAGLVISGEETLRELMVRSDRPLASLLHAAEQGRPQSMGFTEGPRGVNAEHIWCAMQQLDRHVQRELFLMFMANVHHFGRRRSLTDNLLLRVRFGYKLLYPQTIPKVGNP